MPPGDALIGTRIAQEVAQHADRLGDRPTPRGSVRGNPQRSDRAAHRGPSQAELADVLPTPRDLQRTDHGDARPAVAGLQPRGRDAACRVDDSGAHVYSVQNPGRPEYLHDVIGYATIGSGAIHAVQSMIDFGHSTKAQYHETVFRVYASKRRAEVAPGVGLDTDMAVISAGRDSLADQRRAGAASYHLRGVPDHHHERLDEEAGMTSRSSRSAHSSAGNTTDAP